MVATTRSARSTDPSDIPVEPIREQPFAWSDPNTHQRLTPCRSDDPRPGGMLLSVDSRGRVVSPVYGNPFDPDVLGWKLLDSEALGVDPHEVVEFWEAEAARHPEQVRVLVAHEPPLFELLSDRDHWRTVIQNVENTFLEEGPGPAGQVLGAALAMRGGQQQDGGEPGEGDAADGQQRIPGGGNAPRGEPDPETMEMMARLQKNMEFFIGYEVPPFAKYVPDFAALQASSVRVVGAAGDETEGEPPHRAAIAVAERLGTQPVMFPGDHSGFGIQPEAFAAKLRDILSSS